MARNSFFQPELTSNENGTGWFAVMRENGKPHCSCGRPLQKISDSLWKCSYGFPVFNLDEGDCMIDKFGTMYFRNKSHESNNERRNK